MCIGVPGRIISHEGNDAIVDVGGSTREVSMMLLDGAGLNDWVLVHAGYAMSKVDESQALEILEYLQQMADSFGDTA